MTREEFEYHLTQIILDARVEGCHRSGRVNKVKDDIESLEQSIQFDREKLNEFYNRYLEETK